jgi:outer membrane PBP1 activator LpoA protein
MKPFAWIMAAAGSILLASCGGQGDDTLGDQAQETAEARADALEDAADNAGGSGEDAMEAQADAVR